MNTKPESITPLQGFIQDLGFSEIFVIVGILLLKYRNLVMEDEYLLIREHQSKRCSRIHQEV